MQQLSLPRSEIRVLLLEGIAASAEECFRKAGYTQLHARSGSLAREELQAELASAHIVGIRSRTHLDAELLRSSPKLLALGCFCIGTNQVDLDTARNLGVPVFNAPYSNTRSVAELVLAEAILLLRRVPEKNMDCHRGGWAKTAQDSYEVRGKTIGIVGYGHIGSQVGVLAEGLGMQVVYHDIVPKLALGNARAVHDLEEVLRTCDVLTLHVPETPQTQNMIAEAQLALLKPGAALINASRGTVVDLEALAGRLRAGHLAGAAVDVFPVEPRGSAQEFSSPLVGLDNALLTPHIGGSTQEAQSNIGLEVASKLVRYSDNGSTLSAVNFPEVALPHQAGCRRLLHIHENRPGVLSAINEAIASSEANIDGQYLQTLADVGYVVVDLAATREQAQDLRQVLRQIPGTLRTRVLY